ncbi:hypothetical protein OAE54_01010, partial [bacterium]|nr:hypothetical protein [bacterium]
PPIPGPPHCGICPAACDMGFARPIAPGGGSALGGENAQPVLKIATMPPSIRFLIDCIIIS